MYFLFLMMFLVTFFLIYFVVRVEHINTCNIKDVLINLFMSSVRLPINSGLSVVKFWGSQTLYADFQLSGVLAPLRLFFKRKLYCSCLTISTFLIPVLSNYASFFLLVTLLQLFLLKLAKAWKRGLQASLRGPSGQCCPLDSCCQLPLNSDCSVLFWFVSCFFLLCCIENRSDQGRSKKST